MNTRNVYKQSFPIAFTTERVTRERPHQWNVTLRRPHGQEGGIEIGYVFEHATGDPDDPDRVGYQAQLNFGGLDYEVDLPPDPKFLIPMEGDPDCYDEIERTPGLGIATKLGAARLVANEAMKHILGRATPPEASNDESP